MTCYDCDGCERNYIHISQLGEFERKIKIGKLKIKKTIWLCKWCMTRGKIKYWIDNGFVELMPSRSGNTEKEVKE